jgi:hypothetical protein
MYPLDLAAFRATPLNRQPFEYLIVPGFVRPEARAGIHVDYPKIYGPGSFPAQVLRYGPAFGSLLSVLQSEETRRAFEEKFGVSLEHCGTMVTVRGQSGTKDGNIHTDALNKVITVLIYMNPSWEQSGGRLRLLRSATDIDSTLVEVPPLEGTLVAFRRSHNSYHGHKPFIGPRRVVQFNWMTSTAAARWELTRHRFSAWWKKIQSLLRGGGKSSSQGDLLRSGKA